MIICIIIYSLLAVGIISFILRNVFTNLYYKWKYVEEYYAPTTRERVWKDSQLIYLPNENYNEKLYKKATKKKTFYDKMSSDFFFGLGMVGCIGGGLLTLIFSLIVLTENCFQSSDIAYLNMLETRSAYTRELKTNPENEHLYQDIVKFNNSLREIKMKYDNPWSSWLINSKIAQNIDYIEVEYVYNNT